MALVKTWTFESSSNPNKTYETQLHDGGNTSCNCPGWTKRSVRTCKHTRMVEQGIADRYAVSVWESRLRAVPVAQAVPQWRGPVAAPTPAVSTPDKNTAKLARIKERLAQEKKEKLEAAAPMRKVNWQRAMRPDAQVSA